MQRFIGLSLAMLVVHMATFATAGELKSGLQVGEAAGAFNVKDVTGPKQGTSLCYRCAFGGRQVVNIQAREITDELVSMVKQIDSLVDDAGTMTGDSKHAFVVLLTNDPDSAEAKLAEVAGKQKIKNTPLTLFDGITGPSGYKIAKDADVTVMMWGGHKVSVNHAFAKGELNAEAVKEVVAEAKKHLK